MIQGRKGLNPLKLDLRDRYYARHLIFGSAIPSQLPISYRAAGTVSDNEQGASNFCTDYTTCAMAEREDGKSYSRSYHAMCETRLLGHNSDQDGSDLRTALTVAIRYGFLLKENEPFDWKNTNNADYAADPKNWDVAKLDPLAIQNAHPGYTWVYQNNSKDWFDSVKTALWDKRDHNGTITCGTPWYDEWDAVGATGLLSMPSKSPVAYHDHEILGFDTINGVEVLISNPWQGSNFGNSGVVYFPRDVFNSAMSVSGASAGCLDNIDKNAIANTRQWYISLLQIFVDLLQKLRDKLLYNK